MFFDIPSKELSIKYVRKFRRFQPASTEQNIDPGGVLRQMYEHIVKKYFHLKTSFPHTADFTRTIEHLNENRCVVKVSEATDCSKMSSTCVALSS